MGFVEAKPAKENKPTQGHFKKAGVPPTRVRREVKLEARRRSGEGGRSGQRLHLCRWRARGCDRHQPRQGLSGRREAPPLRAAAARRTARCSIAPRDRLAPRRFPSRVVKGMRMGGHMGSDRVTVRNLKVLRVDAENNLLLVEGAVPGGPNSVVVIRKAVAAKRSRSRRSSR